MQAKRVRIADPALFLLWGICCCVLFMARDGKGPKIQKKAADNLNPQNRPGTAWCGQKCGQIKENSPETYVSRLLFGGGGDGSRTHVRKHFHWNFSGCSFCFKISLQTAPKSRLCPRLSRCSLMLPGFHMKFSCMLDTVHPAYR